MCFEHLYPPPENAAQPEAVPRANRRHFAAATIRPSPVRHNRGTARGRRSSARAFGSEHYSFGSISRRHATRRSVGGACHAAKPSNGSMLALLCCWSRSTRRAMRRAQSLSSHLVPMLGRWERSLQEGWLWACAEPVGGLRQRSPPSENAVLRCMEYLPNNPSVQNSHGRQESSSQ